MTISELLKKRGQTWQAMKDFLDAHPEMSAEDKTAYDRMEKELDETNEQIKRVEKLEAVRDSFGGGAAFAPNPKDGTGDDKTGRASKAYSNAFWNVMRYKNGVLNEANVNPLTVGADSEGGYLVPDEFERRLIEGLEGVNIMRSMATVIRTESGERKIPVVASKGEAYWIEEEGSYPEDDPSFGQKTLGAFKVGRLIKASEELMGDAFFDVEAYLTREFARSVGATEESAFFVGNGTGKPTGVLNDAETGITSAAANKITADELIDLFYSLKSPYRSRAAWVFNDATVKEIRKLKTGDGAYLWQPALTAGTPDMIMNRPVKTTAAMPTIASSAKVAAIGDFSYYWIAQRRGIVFRRLNELYAATGQVGFIGHERVDGKLILSEAVKTLVMHA